MTHPTICGLTAALVAAAVVAVHLTAQGPTPPSRNRRVWTGTIDDRETLLNETDTTPIRRPVRYFQDVNVRFRFVSEDDPDRPGFTRWVSRHLSWTGYGMSASTIAGRECIGSGSLDLGPAEGYDQTTPDQEARLRIPCKEWNAPNVWSFIKMPNPKVRLPVIDMSMTNCEPTRRWSVGGVRYTLSVSGDQDLGAVLEVDQAGYAAFVPKPGDTLTFTANSTSGPVRFRFELDRDGTSWFPGYATNANVDDVFFVRHNLTHLRGEYANDGPDVIFDSKHFSSVGWSRTDPTIVETRLAESAAVVTVTAMDYGAVGRLRAFAQPADCGGAWQSVPVQIGGHARESVAIPPDEDNNLMADALEQYRGLDSGADVDAEPKGNGMAGDGLTAFEEYRGFQIRGSGCPGQPESGAAVEPGMPPPEPFPDEERPSGIPGWDDEHIRTTPRHKNLFVHALDPELALMTDDFAWASDLSVHLICEAGYVDNDTRVVNFTLQQANLREWRGKRISQDESQHGVWVVAVGYNPFGMGAAVVSVDLDSGVLGPPKYSLGVFVTKPFLIADRVEGETNLPYRRRVGLESAAFTSVLTHELSHVVGVPHHADRIENWRVVMGKWNVTPPASVFQRTGAPMVYSSSEEARRAIEEADLGGLLVLPGTDCEEQRRMYREGRFAGCWALTIARRGQQNSGNFECPMRYAGADYYEPPGSTAVYRWTGYVGGPGPGHMNVDAWEGNLLKYHNELDRLPTGKLCARTTGTEINALPRDMNHSGDAGRDKPCREFLVVNDVAARGVR